LSDVIDKLLSNERLAQEKTFQFLKHSQIAYVDTLPALRRSLSQELYARTASDIHPNRNGYRGIGEAVFEELKRLSPADRQAGKLVSRPVNIPNSSLAGAPE